MKDEKKIGTDPYKGVRDFYPEEMAAQKRIFGVMAATAEKFGYVEYGASVLEPAELYRAKSGEEIVSEQTYTFIDRGEREVTLRPEMTPTVARMVAARKRELSFPLRWYSIPNLFRYEQPQRGRLREHWQLNVDLFGADGVAADAEVISLAHSIMTAFGAKQQDFEIRVNNRKLLNFILGDYLALGTDESHKISKLIDRKDKMSAEDFQKQTGEILGGKAEKFAALWNSKPESWPAEIKASEGWIEREQLCSTLAGRGITNVIADQDLVRGFDYYTGNIFEVFDTDPKNRRALFGGGRYDNLTALFGGDAVPAVGFGMGDVTIRDFLETHGLMAEYRSPTDLCLCVASPEAQEAAEGLAGRLRANGLNVAVSIGGKKVGDQIKAADKQKIPFIAVIGDDEIASKKYKIKNLKTGEESEGAENAIAALIKK